MWSIEQAAALYNIENWGNNFFKINEQGNVIVDPRRDGQCIDLKELVEDLQQQDLPLPLLIRFSDILEQRIAKIYGCFQKAAQEFNYKGQYFGVYPIKVNPQQQVVEEIVQFGQSYHFGLEAGSKPELHAVLAMMDHSEALIICNGYKDEAYVQLALMGQKLGRRVFIVVEKLAELELIFRVAKQLNVKPALGLRVKLTTITSSRWSASGGEFSKFGLTAAEVMEAVTIAKAAGQLSSIQLLHFHLGSQIPNIHHIKKSLQEVSRFYVELFRLDCPIQYIDVGGGLGVDYEGSRSASDYSVNYSIQEYANDIVYHLLSICEEEQLPHPHIISESGRALTAHHSVMIFNVLESTQMPQWSDTLRVEESDDTIIHDLYEILQELTPDKLREPWHDTLELKDQAMHKFSMGLLSLESRAKADRLFWSIAHRIEALLHEVESVPEEFQNFHETLAAKYFCNFSIFQSLPDAWAIKHVFPIMPIHRLHEEPTQQATLQDITCDSDGQVDQFIQHRNIHPMIPVHPIQDGAPYWLGVFLVGAYQEILGDLHNLFGDTNTVHVALNEDGSWHYKQRIEGENVTDVLEYVQFQSKDLLERMSHLVGVSVGEGRITRQEADEVMQLYRKGLQGYTYLVSS